MPDKLLNLNLNLKNLTDVDLFNKTNEFKRRYEDGETLDDLLLESFATVREVSKRTLGLRHFDVQMIGGITMHSGKIAEMRTGEGKTLVATLPVYLNAITGRGVHVVTVNDYLARRDARWMAPIYSSLGLSIGVLQMASRTENGQKAFIVDLEKTSSIEDQNQLVMVRPTTEHINLMWFMEPIVNLDLIICGTTLLIVCRIGFREVTIIRLLMKSTIF